MLFAREAHKNQRRKYSNNPYADHLAEVAGIVASVNPDPTAIAVAWLHDTIEDQGVTEDEIRARFGDRVAYGVLMLSDLEPGNRATRKAACRARLASSEPWVQTIKVADLMSNASSIVVHDPGFARIFLEEMQLLIAAMPGADQRLRDHALEHFQGAR